MPFSIHASGSRMAPEMIDVASEEQQSDHQLAPTTDPPASTPPFRGMPTLSAHAAAEAYDGVLDRRSLRKTPGLYTRAWHRFRANHVAMTALVVLSLIVVFVLCAGLISTYVTGFTPQENHLADKLKPPLTDGYILGSDGNGRDILTRLAYGGRISIMIASLYSPGPVGLAFILAFVSWPGIARIVRGEVLALRGREYVDAARTLGASSVRIVLRHILPNVMPLLVVYISLIIPGLILAETGLSFIGIGVQVPTPSWGNMLGDAQQFFRTNVSNVIIPGLMIYITSLTMYLVGSGLRDAFDPRLSE